MERNGIVGMRKMCGVKGGCGDKKNERSNWEALVFFCMEKKKIEGYGLRQCGVHFRLSSADDDDGFDLCCFLSCCSVC